MYVRRKMVILQNYRWHATVDKCYKIRQLIFTFLEAL